MNSTGKEFEKKWQRHLKYRAQRIRDMEARFPLGVGIMVREHYLAESLIWVRVVRFFYDTWSLMVELERLDGRLEVREVHELFDI